MSNNDDEKEVEVDLNSKKIWQLEDTLSFGKFKGRTVKYVVAKEPSLLMWYHDNIDWFELDEEILDTCEQLVEASKHRGRDWHRDAIFDSNDEIDDDTFEVDPNR